MASTFVQLKEEVLDIVQDSSFTTTKIGQFLNDGLKEISGSQMPLILLPELETTETITTAAGSAYTLLPSDYQKRLFRCYSTTNGRQIKVFGSEALLLRHQHKINLTGPVWGVAVKGLSLAYQRIPSSAESLLVHYYRRPTSLSIGTDVPTCLPDHLAETLLVNYACRRCFERIEDGVDGAKVNSQYHDSLFNQHMQALMFYLGPEAKEPTEFVDELNLHYRYDWGPSDGWSH